VPLQLGPERIVSLGWIPRDRVRVTQSHFLAVREQR
jgi:hypothetical protein